MVFKGSEAEARTRLLLALWELGASGEAMKRADMLEKVVRKGERNGDYQLFLDALQEKEAIAIYKQGRTQYVHITPDSLRALLVASLQDSDLEFGAHIGKNKANSLLRLIREMAKASVPVLNGAASPVAFNGNGNGNARESITDYEEFKHVTLNVYNMLNRDYNMDDLVPIYRIRREIGDRVSRQQFSEWLFEMQAEDFFQLLESGIEDNAPDKVEDSVTTSFGKLRCYAKRLTN